MITPSDPCATSSLPQTSIWVVTGTDTEVGKTWTTAVFAGEILRGTGQVHIDKPVQTGLQPGEPGDVEECFDLMGHPKGLTGSEGARLGPAMAPRDALDWSDSTDVELPSMESHLARWNSHLSTSTTLVIEGSGGVTVALTPEGETVVEVVETLRRRADRVAAGNLRVRLALVCRPGLGTQNHTQLAMEHLDRRGVLPSCLVVSGTSSRPDAVERANLRFLMHRAAEYRARMFTIQRGSLCLEEFRGGWL
ncbi:MULTISPECIES: ATP-dependent dethiobiotin synthetase BioD [Micrococcaceae]|uniref:ATP-dependent dethiobiotin synthetase BioD n=1 Tax=unclassified Kocuria TaxID=2649579 RepID=UPI0013EA80E2|nr:MULTISPECIES: dethiobiotin synthase [unclassified Kocuria]